MLYGELLRRVLRRGQNYIERDDGMTGETFFYGYSEAEVDLVMRFLHSSREVMVFLDEQYFSKGELLRIKRVADGFPQAELAKMLKLNTGTLSAVENGLRPIPKRCEKQVDTYLYEQWYMDKTLIYSVAELNEGCEEDEDSDDDNNDVNFYLHFCEDGWRF